MTGSTPSPPINVERAGTDPAAGVAARKPLL
jgi:hypothetical protein